MQADRNKTEELKILSVGNSFSVDTMQYVAEIALSLGVKSVKLGNLFVGGCSLNRHMAHAEADLPAYRYYTNDGSGYSAVEKVRISEAVRSENWDFISIQHGTKDGSRYTDPASYNKLPALIAYLKELAGDKTKIAFNMTWVGEPWHTHHEIVSYGGDQLLIYRKITEVTQNVVLPTKGLDILSPTGTAIQNARTYFPEGSLSRDGYHLSYTTGRYIAGLTFYKALTGAEIDRIAYAPDGVDEEAKAIAIESANRAIRVPFAVTAFEKV